MKLSFRYLTEAADQLFVHLNGNFTGAYILLVKKKNLYLSMTGA